MNALRQLSPAGQVGLLFVLLFGALTVATLVALLRSLREAASPEQQARRDRSHRGLRALWVGAVLFWMAWAAGPIGATLLFAVCSYLALREFVTLMDTRRSDHRGLVLAFFVVLPLQYVLVANRNFDLFSVLIPVYVFFALPVVSALAGDPERFLERNATIQWGVTVCVYGLSHAPAVLLLQFPGQADRGAFLVFFLVVVVTCAQLAQAVASRRLRRRPVARLISRSFSYRAWGIGALAAGAVGGALAWITPFKPPQAMLIALIASGCGTLGAFVMQALQRDASLQAWRARQAGGRVAQPGGHAHHAVNGGHVHRTVTGGHVHRTVTGAVGLLDRAAPLCFAAPVFFHSVRWYFKAAV